MKLRVLAAVYCLAVGVLFASTNTQSQTLELEYSTYLGGLTSYTFGYGIAVEGSEAFIVGQTLSSTFPVVSPYQSTNSDYGDVFITKLSSSGSELLYSTYLGGSSWDYGYGIAVESGIAYITGKTDSFDFPTVNPYQASNMTVTDIFIASLSSSGSNLLYSTYLGGSSQEAGRGLAVESGIVYLTGYTTSADFPTVNPYQASPDDSLGYYGEAFVGCLSSTGSNLVYCTFLGGSYGECGYGIAVESGVASITGYTDSFDFPIENAYQASLFGCQDAFVSRLTSSGSSLIYSTYLGGNSGDEALGICLDSMNNAYVTGNTSSFNFPIQNPYQPSNAGGIDAFISKLSSSGSYLNYSTYLGGTTDDEGHGICVSSHDQLYVVGSTESADFSTKNSYQSSLAGSEDVFVSSFSSSGSILSYSTYLGGTYDDQGYGVAIDSENRIYLTGEVDSYNFPTVNPYQPIKLGGGAAFVSCLVFMPSPTPTSTVTPTPTTTPTVTPTPFGYKTVTPTPSVTATPFVPPTPPPTAPPTPSPIPTPEFQNPIIDSGDYNGDGTSDIAIFRGSSGMWSVRGVTRAYFGSSSDIPIPGDYDGDGTADIGIFRPGSGLWGVRGVTRVYYGSASDIPIPGDYNGDGTCDVGIFRSSSGLWAVVGVTRAYFGSGSDIAVPGDYNGDGRKNIAIFRPGSGMWAFQGLPRVYFGSSSDTVVPGDYDGDGTWEAAIFRPVSGMWAVTGLPRAYYGKSSDYPVPADYNGDSIDDIGIFRASSGLWGIRNISRAYFGSLGDIPVTR